MGVCYQYSGKLNGGGVVQNDLSGQNFGKVGVETLIFRHLLGRVQVGGQARTIDGGLVSVAG